MTGVQTCALPICKRSEAAKARAEKILEAVRGGQKLDEAGKEFGLTPEMTPAVRRTIDGTLPQNITPDLVGQLFRLKQDEYGLATGRDGYFVARLTEIAPADPAADAAGVQNLRADLRQRMASDMGASLTDALKRRLGVSVDAEVVGTVQ